MLTKRGSSNGGQTVQNLVRILIIALLLVVKGCVASRTGIVCFTVSSPDRTSIFGCGIEVDPKVVTLKGADGPHAGRSTAVGSDSRTLTLS